MADDLTEEQIKAFRLADNKTAELASWDFDLLDTELDSILDIDMADFGFDEKIEPLLNELEDENQDYEQNPEIEVTIQFKNVQEWRKYEEELRNVVNGFDDVNVKVGAFDEN